MEKESPDSEEQKGRGRERMKDQKGWQEREKQEREGKIKRR